MTLLKAKAKVNLFFHVVGKREDGYHLIESLAIFAQDIYDEIEIIESEKYQLTLKPSEFTKDLVGKNLMETALESFSPNKNYHLTLNKNIPVGAGLGGGSSDAAVIARYFLKESHLNEKQIEELKNIGADLPVCYTQMPQFVAGIGERLTEIKNLPKFYMIVVNPRISLLTKDVFKNFSREFSSNSETILTDFKNDFDYFIDFLLNKRNDLTKAAIDLLPEIAEVLDLLNLQEGCKFSRMSGSGASCFAIFKDLEAAQLAKNNIAKLKPNYWINISS